MNRVALWILAQIIFLISAQAVPPVLNYAGQVTVNGEAFDGNGLFKFALVNADGTTTFWSNDGTSVDGSEPQASVAVPVNGGLYAVLLGNSAQPGMGAIDPAVFAQHNDAKLRVWFSDGVNGFQQLSPDRPFASVPYAFSAGVAQTAGFSPIANGAVNLDMLSEDLKTQINAPISRSRLTQEVVADINATIGLDRLSSEIISKLEQNATITNGSVTGSKMADGAITTDKLNEQILKYLKPEITTQPQAQTVYADTNVSFSVSAEGKYLSYQWKKDGVDLTGETNATLTITDANATLHDGNYSVVVSNDFGSVETDETELAILNWDPKIIDQIKLWLDAKDSTSISKDSSSKVIQWRDKSGHGNHAIQENTSMQPTLNEMQLDFDSDDIFEISNDPINGLQNPCVVIVGKFNNPRRWDNTMISFDGEGSGWQVRQYSDSFDKITFTIRGTSSVDDQNVNNTENSTFFILSGYRKDSNTRIINHNGSQTFIDNDTGAISYNGINKSAIGGRFQGDNFTSASGYLDGSIKEIILADEVIVSDVSRLEGYLAHKWGLISNLPSDHPYKNNHP
jgi:PBP1b-binding outer membrane lipoprotein LpoB